MRGLLRQNYSLAKHTSWRIGGSAQYFYEPYDLQDLSFFLQNWREEPLVLLGAGSNVLLPDGIIPGVVICLRGRLNNIEETSDENILRFEAGVSLSRLVSECMRREMVDAVFLAGIPGTLGGALAMNAGAYGDSIWNHVKRVVTIDRGGKVRSREASEFCASYRKIENLNGEWFVNCDLFFAKGNVLDAKSKMEELLAKRRASQPLDEPNCGSVFRNPPGDYAARLIEACGLKGCRVGDAEVSTKHANFIVNKGKAASSDVKELINMIKDRVLAMHGVTLDLEVRLL